MNETNKDDTPSLGCVYEILHCGSKCGFIEIQDVNFGNRYIKYKCLKVFNTKNIVTMLVVKVVEYNSNSYGPIIAQKEFNYPETIFYFLYWKILLNCKWIDKSLCSYFDSWVKWWNTERF